MDLQDLLEQFFSYLRGIWRYRWHCLGLAWLFCLVGWFAVHRMPDEYQASAQVYVDTDSVLRPLLQGIAADFNAPERQVELMARTFLSRPNLEKVVRYTDLDLRAQNRQELDLLVDELRRATRLRGSDKRNLFTITYSDADPVLAKNIVQALLNVFVENASVGGEREVLSDTAQRFLQRQIAEYEQRLLDAEQRLAEFKRTNLGLLPADGRNYYQSMLDVRNQLQAAQLAQAQAEERRDSLRRQLDGEDPIRGLSEAQRAPVARAIAPVVDLPIQRRIAQLEQNLDGLLVRYTEQHPDIVILRQQLENLKVQRDEQIKDLMAARRATGGNASGLGLGSQRQRVYEEIRLALVEAEGQVAERGTQVNNYRAQLARLEQQVHAVPEVEAQLVAMNRDYQVMRRNYEALVSRLESARLSRQAGQTAEDVRFQVIEPPFVPPEPAGPDRPALMSGVLVAGVGAGLGLGFVFSQLFPTFDTRRTLMRTLNIPVLGSVELRMAPGAVRRQRLWVLFYLLVGLGLFMSYALLVVLETRGISLTYLLQRLADRVL
ncbi:MAG: XrtA system polysaccharide chain length determinant [Candidatus Competibacterales bacterium]